MKRGSRTNTVANQQAAAFRRLCVETIELDLMDEYGMAAAFRRLCVETATLLGAKQFKGGSRLQAAVC